MMLTFKRSWWHPFTVWEIVIGGKVVGTIRKEAADRFVVCDDHDTLLIAATRKEAERRVHDGACLLRAAS